jgi:hypothetical protein
MISRFRTLVRRGSEVMKQKPKRIQASLLLRRDGKLLLSHDRVLMLEAIGAYGSILKAAQAAGRSYASFFLCTFFA